MNLLLDELPAKISVNEREYSIRTNFRDWINFEITLLGDSSETEKSKLLNYILYGIVPEDIERTIHEIIKFYQCGETNKSVANRSVSQKRIYDYKQDQFLIYTAFIQYYKINLNVIKFMHWWTFRQLFLELPDESKMKKVMMYRSININSSMSPEQKKFYAEMKRTYALPTKGDAKKKAVGFGTILAGGMKTKEP